MTSAEAVSCFHTMTEDAYEILDAWESSDSYYFHMTGRGTHFKSEFDGEIWRLKKDSVFPVPYPSPYELPESFWTADKII